MLHLFNKVYINLDGFVDYSINRVIISNNLSVYSSRTAGEVIHQVKTVDELIGADKEYKDYISFFSKMSSEDRQIVLYLDNQSFCKIVANWYKILFANIDAISAFNVVKSYFAKSKLIGVFDNRDYDGVDNFEPTFEEFKLAFDSVSVSDADAKALITSFADKLSLEFLLSSYVYNKAHKAELKKTIQSLVKRHIEHMLLETKEFVYKRALKESFAKKVGIKTYQFNNVDEIVNDPALKVLTASNFWKSKGVTNFGSQSNINLKLITDAEIAELIKLLSSAASGEYDHDLLDSIPVDYIKYVRKDEMSDEDLDNFLTKEKNSVEYGWASPDMSSINIYFIDYVLDNFLESPEKLKPYSIRI